MILSRFIRVRAQGLIEDGAHAVLLRHQCCREKGHRHTFRTSLPAGRSYAPAQDLTQPLAHLTSTNLRRKVAPTAGPFERRGRGAKRFPHPPDPLRFAVEDKLDERLSRVVPTDEPFVLLRRGLQQKCRAKR